MRVSKLLTNVRECDTNNETDEAEGWQMFLSQRVRGAGIRAAGILQDGPLRVRGKAKRLSIAQRDGMRQLPGICWYPAEGTVFSVNQGGIADNILIRPWQKNLLSGAFCFPDERVRTFYFRRKRI